ncbi:hypothetical protein HYFRA_00012394 [Hymenoscyphus fraxineus]|uniref:NAD(P)-binding protein n=1 Tax=Hymenoscyphus fraxineus TaxID=746836 RepID=A0A9N9PYF0_9HELO|nr:hypothetical protein HYFRA_00012394 [Hymenoscyphus fraxineus]
MPTSHFSTTPTQQASIPRFFFNQITTKPTLSKSDIHSQTAIVTGSNSGVGLETSRQLLSLGLSKLVLAVRNEDLGHAAAAALSSGQILTSDTTIEVWKLDLSSYDSIVAFSKRAASLERLDIVVLNAGITPAVFKINEQTKHSECIQVNYLSTALLAILLLPVIKRQRSPTRLNIVSSEVAAWTSFPQKDSTSILDALDTDEKTDMVDHMFISKLLGQFFVAELAKKVPSSVAIINCASPGTVWDSRFNREHEKTFAGGIMQWINWMYGNSSRVAARMITDAVVSKGEESHGQFLSFQKIVPMAAIIYTPEGEKISAQLWKETLAEFSWAKVEDILIDIAA